MIYKPPQILYGLSLETVAGKYMSDYRRVYIEHPRLRLDGVYIAVCHYVYVPFYQSHPFIGPSVDLLASKQTSRAQRKCMDQCKLHGDSETG